MTNQPMSATASHLVEFYGYKMSESSIGDQKVIGLYDDDNEPVIYDSNLDQPFDNTLFIGNEDVGIMFDITSIIM